MSENRAPSIFGFTPGQQRRVDRYWHLLNAPDSILDSTELSTAADRIAGKDDVVKRRLSRLNDERFHGLKRNFSRKIFDRCLYALADDNQTGALASCRDGVCIGIWRNDSDKFMITIRFGEAGEDNFRQITFSSQSEDPTTLALYSYHGKFGELALLIQKAAEPFIDLQSAPTVMRQESRDFVEIQIGGAERPVPGFKKDRLPTAECGDH